MFRSLEMLVQPARLKFLFKFGTVNGIAVTGQVAHRWSRDSLR
jgi:hypothetical protein